MLTLSVAVATISVNIKTLSVDVATHVEKVSSARLIVLSA